MNISRPYLVFVIATIMDESAGIVERLSAVITRHRIVCSLYVKVKKTQDRAEREISDPDPDSKNRICLWALGSTVYGKFGKTLVDKNEISDELRRRYPAVFDKLYQPSARDSSKMVYTNPTVPIEVSVSDSQEPILESVFSCLYRVDDFQDGTKFEEYFISEEYNVSDVPGHYVAARFIFRHCDDGLFDILGMAEEPATAILDADWSKEILILFLPYVMKHENASDTLHLNVERLYLLNRKENQLAVSEFGRRICVLTEEERFRLCTLVFSSKYFHGKVELPDAGYFVANEERCFLNEVKFRQDDVKNDAVGRHYKEWMIRCYMASLPFHYDTEYDKTYYLSLVRNVSPKNARSSNDLFVYRHGKSDWHYDLNYYLVNVFTNVRLTL